MRTALSAFTQLTEANLAAWNTLIQPDPPLSPEKWLHWWEAVKANQARYVQETSRDWMCQLARGRCVLNDQLERLSSRRDALAAQLAHTTVRAMAIATRARQEANDRRVFSVALPAGQRSNGGDRRFVQPDDYPEA